MQGPKNYPSAVQETPTMATDDCTVALCVPVSVAKQRQLDLIDELQLRLHGFLHVNTGHLSSTTTGMSTSSSKQEVAQVALCVPVSVQRHEHRGRTACRMKRSTHLAANLPTNAGNTARTVSQQNPAKNMSLLQSATSAA